MPLAIAARSPADRGPAVTGPVVRGHGPTGVLSALGTPQLPVSALSPADLLYLQRCAGNEAVCALMSGCPGDEVQRAPAGPAAAKSKAAPAKAKPPPFPFAPSCDLKIPIEGSAPGFAATAKDDEDIEWIEGVKEGNPPLPDQIDLTFQASSEEKASKTVRAQWEKKIVACETAEKTRLAKVSATGVKLPTHADDVKAAETASQAKIAELRTNLEALVASTEAKYASGRDNNRNVFMETMRCYLGSDAATKDHFQKLEQVTEFPAGPWLYKDAAEALRGVAADMGGKDKLPAADNAQNLRERHLHYKEQQGHPMGFSIDYYPSDNPMISEEQRVALLELITGKTSHVEAGAFGTRRKRIEKIAAGTDKDVETFFNNFDVAFEKTKKASDAFRLAPGSDEMKALDKAKDNYVKSQTELPKAEQTLADLEAQIAKLGSGGDAKQRQALEEKRAAAATSKQELEAARDAIPGLLAKAFAPWLKQIKTRITEIEKIGTDAKAAGVAMDELPDQESLDSAATILPKMAALEQKIADAEAKAKQPTPPPAPTVKGSKAKPKKAPAPPPLDAWRKQDKKWNDAVAPILASMDAALPAQAAKKDRTIQDRLAQVAALRPWVDDPAKKADWEGLPTLRKLQTSLTQDTRFVFGSVKMANAIAAGSGDAKDVPVYQLAKKGFFNPTDTYSLAFFKTMMKHGFDPGVTWGPGWTDAMHFDYVQGFHQIVKYACGPGETKKKKKK